MMAFLAALMVILGFVGIHYLPKMKIKVKSKIKKEIYSGLFVLAYVISFISIIFGSWYFLTWANLDLIRQIQSK
jgi:hypothetical protein